MAASMAAKEALPDIPANLVSTLWLTPPGFDIAQVHGTVRGITVRSRNVVLSTFGLLNACVGGNIGVYTELCEQARQVAYERMLKQAVDRGGNAVLGMHYDCCEIAGGITEVCAYGTAVTLQRSQ